MRIRGSCVGAWLLLLAAPGFAGVTITSPSVANPGSPVHFVASGASSCAKGIAAMGIYTAPSVLAYKVSASHIDTLVPMNSGSYDVVVQQWDHCGGSASAHMILDVGAPAGKQTFADLQSQSGWSGFALLPPAFGICTTCKSSGPELNWAWIPNVSSPSMDGKSTKSVYGGGTVQWADVLWNNHLIGNSSSQGLYDWSGTLVPQYTDFTYDVYFWIKDASVSQAVEFDINQFFGGKSFIWGHECRIAGGHQWDTWNNQTKHWVPSGIPCYPLSGAWNHLIIHVQRTPNDQLLFKTITLNGKTATLNRYDTPTTSSWHGITINYQIDGNIKGTPYNVFVDKLNFTIQ